MSEHPKRRLVFISASFLSREFDMLITAIPQKMKESIFFFGSERRWVFPESPEDIEEQLKQPTPYENFSDEFKNFILEKEKEGLVYWLKPKKDYEDVSRFFEGIIDPYTGQPYKPLILDGEWWYCDYIPYVSLTKARAPQIVANFRKGEHDYSPVIELLHQSNPTMIPVLSFQTFR